MNKAPNNGTGSGGDERNTNVRRYKSTSNPPKASSSNASLPGRQSEVESFNRPKHIGGSVVKPQAVGRNNQRSKLRSPVKTGLGQPSQSMNRVNKPVSINRVAKKPSEDLKEKSQMTKMKQEAESVEQKQKTESVEQKQKTSNVQTDSKEPTEQVEINKQIKESNDTEEQSSNQQENRNANGLNGKEGTPQENLKEEESKENGNAEQNGKEVSETNEKEEDFKLQLEVEENGLKSDEGTQNELPEIEANKQDESQKLSDEGVQEDAQPASESCSVDVVESTTSEISETTTEPSTPSEIKNKDNENQDANSDPLSYNSSIMLKDVQIKLNDCLKDSKSLSRMKPFKSCNHNRQMPVFDGEENNVEQSLPEYAHKEATFGTTLRKISGRNSIGRMRNVTLRDRQPSPNSSLFVNTSNLSFDDMTSDYKILRHRSALSELSSSINGTPYDRKRKLIEESTSVVKKPKTEESSNLLNSSFEFLKYPFQRPSQNSTPYKFQADKHNLNTGEEVQVDESGAARKWCAIM